MRLSELVFRCGGADPELVIEDEDGIPQPVASIDHGLMVIDGAATRFVLLEPCRDEES